MRHLRKLLAQFSGTNSTRGRRSIKRCAGFRTKLQGPQSRQRSTCLPRSGPATRTYCRRKFAGAEDSRLRRSDEGPVWKERFGEHVKGLGCKERDAGASERVIHLRSFEG